MGPDGKRLVANHRASRQIIIHSFIRPLTRAYGGWLWWLQVGGLDVQEVTAVTHRSEKSGADITDAALIRCANDCSVSFSGA